MEQCTGLDYCFFPQQYTTRTLAISRSSTPYRWSNCWCCLAFSRHLYGWRCARYVAAWSIESLSNVNVLGFWRPVVGIDAFDLREDEIDITPWLPVLCDGKSHSFEIKVVGLTDDGNGNAKISSIGGYWVVTGKVFLWLDLANSTTTGSPPNIVRPSPQFFITAEAGKEGNNPNNTLNYQVLAQRQITTTNTITTSEGSKEVSFSQSLSFSNLAAFVNNGNNQTNNAITSGTDTSSSGYTRKFAYPLLVFSAISMSPAGAMTLDGRMDRTKNVQVIGNSVFPSPLDAFASQGPFEASLETNRQNGTAFFFQDATKKVANGAGRTEQTLALQGFKNLKPSAPQMPMEAGAQLYSRHILAANNSIIADSASGMGIGRFVIDNSEDTQLMFEFPIVTQEQVKGGKVIVNSDPDRPLDMNKMLLSLVKSN